MSISLRDALQQVDLEVGRVYQCEVGPLRVKVSVEARDSGPLPAPFNPDDVMLDPWTDFPDMPPANTFRATPGDAVWPEVPTIPDDAIEQ